MELQTEGIFVTFRGYLEGATGGVQVCTREYINVITAAGIKLDLCPFQSDRRLSTRVLRRLNSSPYFRAAEPNLVETVSSVAWREQANFVFLNQVNLSVLVAGLRRHLPKKCKIVLLSHGLESTDLFHTIRLRHELPIGGRFRPTPAAVMGRTLLTEAATRANVDLVCTLSPFDLELERWIGARRALWLPRIIASAPPEWKPRGDRLGFVGTLDHAPNLEGLVQILDCLHQRADLKHVRIRIVGRPPAIGSWLAERYRQIDFLGSLDDGALSEEASTWNAFLHPLFCQARGCSTKLALPMSWHLPIITTSLGCRGYTWKTGSLVIATDPSDFIDQCARLLDLREGMAAREEVIRLARSSPSLEENAEALRSWLTRL